MVNVQSDWPNPRVPCQLGQLASERPKLPSLDGKCVRGWFGSGFAETLDTPDIFERLDLDFTHDWLVDDLPIRAIQGLSTDELPKRLEATLAVLDRELEDRVRIMTFGLPPHIVSVAHRHHDFERILDLLLARPDKVFVTSSVMADGFAAAQPAPPAFPT